VPGARIRCRSALWITVCLLTLVVGCSSAPVRPQSFARPPAAPSRPVTKVLVVVEENHGIAQVRRGMPYAFWLAKTFGYSTRYDAVSYPSLPNYLVMISGHTHGITFDESPRGHPMDGPTVFGRALASGRTAHVYVGGMSQPCQTWTDRRTGYGVPGNPWVYFPSERRQCRSHDVPLGELWPDIREGLLPAVGMVRPNSCNDSHSCSMAVADAWLERMMTRVFAGPDWRSGRLAVLVTADEDNRHQGDRVLTVVVHPSQHHHVVHAKLNHYSIARLYAQVTGTAPLQDARSAPSLADAFHLPLAH
jgi:acid phosphatase